MDNQKKEKMKKKYSLLLFGAGNMMSAICLGSKHFLQDNFKISCYTPSFKSADLLMKKIGGESLAIKNFHEISHDYDFVIFGNGPEHFEKICQYLGDNFFSPNVYFVSLMAGIQLERLEKALAQKSQAQDINITRIMPNTPIICSEGVSLFFNNSLAKKNKDKRNIIENIFNDVSFILDFENEKEFEYLTGITGSGPAYFFHLADIFVKLMEKKGGVNKRDAAASMAKIFLGTGKMIEENLDRLTPCELRDNVVSPGGVTHKALEHLKSKDLAGLFGEAFEVAMKRNKELGEVK